jgi:hypothetical protein
MGMTKGIILSVGMPRAGSGWYYNLTKDLVIASGGIDARKIREKYPLKRLLTEVNCNLGTLSFYRLIPVMLPLFFEPNYVIKLHAERRPLSDLLIQIGLIKPTYIYRDPRDALLSAYEYGQRMSNKGLKNDFTHLTSIEKAIEFMDFYVEVGQGWLASNKALSLKYEDFKLNFDQEVSRLGNFLEIDLNDPRIKEVIESYRPDGKSQKAQGMHFVKGKIGRHLENFTADQLETCDRLFGDFLIQHGYQN